MVCTAYFVVNVSYEVSAAKTCFEEQLLVAGTKQAGWQAGRQGIQACLLHFVPITIALVFVMWMFYKLVCRDQSISLVYISMIATNKYRCLWCYNNLLISVFRTSSERWRQLTTTASRTTSGANVIKLFTTLIYCHSMVIPSFCVIK
jgi:hypothetical protein